MLWKKTWRPEIVLALAGGILMSFCGGGVMVEILRRSHVTGFQSETSAGYLLLTTLSFHGAAIAAGVLFLKVHGIGLREISGLDITRWQRQLLLAAGALAAAVPVMIALKIFSEAVLKKCGVAVEDQRAVELLLNCKSTGLKIYLGFFAVAIAPLAEEFIFRGLIFSGLQKLGWPRCAWLVTSALFAVIHFNLPTFLPLFVFALVMTWLCRRTEGLFAPVLAHSAFNTGNLVLFWLADQFGKTLPNQP